MVIEQLLSDIRQLMVIELVRGIIRQRTVKDEVKYTRHLEVMESKTYVAPQNA